MPPPCRSDGGPSRPEPDLGQNARAAPPTDTYCEMGIDVRAYAMATPERQRGRAGGALTARARCQQPGSEARRLRQVRPRLSPRGVLKLENRPDRFRGGTPIRVYAVDL